MSPQSAQVIQGVFTLIQTVATMFALYKGWDRAVTYFEKKLDHPNAFDKPPADG